MLLTAELSSYSTDSTASKPTKSQIFSVWPLTKKYFEIQNIGETISKENQAKIYEKFTRFNKEKGGFGIGLSLVKKYCDELKFKATCQSENKITKFKIEF